MTTPFRYRPDPDREPIYLAEEVGQWDTDFEFVHPNSLPAFPDGGLYLIHDEVIEATLFTNRGVLGSENSPHSKGSLCTPVLAGTLEDAISRLMSRVTELEDKVDRLENKSLGLEDW